MEVVATRDTTRSRIVEVAARLLQEQGAAAVTTRRVAEGAGVQAPAIYRLFGDKDGLLDAVAEHVMATFVSAKAAVVKDASAQEVDPIKDLRAGWQAYIDFGMANPALYALLSDPARAHRSPAALSGQAVLRSRVHRVALTGRLYVGEQRAVDLIHAAGTGAILTLLSTPTAVRDPGLADDLFQAVLDRIVTDLPPSRGDGPLASAVALRAIAPELHMLSDAERHLLIEWLDRTIATPEPGLPG
ncbi:MAG: TetR/AcrR family transcriptional regulator [Nakamurella sp.]